MVFHLPFVTRLDRVLGAAVGILQVVASLMLVIGGADNEKLAGWVAVIVLTMQVLVT